MSSRPLRAQGRRYGHPDLRTHPYAVTDSNGCAAGGSLAEAALHGLVELIERDAVACWWYTRARRPGVDLDALGDPTIERLRRGYRGIGREVWVLDLTHDLGLPTYAAVSRRATVASGRGEGEGVIVGFGAHPLAKRAVLRAVTEQDQLLPMVTRQRPGGRTGGGGGQDAATREWFASVRCDEQLWLRPAGELREVTGPDSAPSQHFDQLNDLVAVLDGRGIEVVVVDQSRSDVGLAVCRVIAPGLRHFWRRTAPGRLYDVPVALGWVDRRLDEGDLSPWNVFV